MITLEEALAKVSESVNQLGTESIDISNGVGRVLATPIDSDVDSPPFDKALMDGFALRSIDALGSEFQFSDSSDSGTNSSNAQPAAIKLKCIESVTAGELPSLTLGAGECTRIMTGAPLPIGCDFVAMIERCEVVTDENNTAHVIIRDENIQAERNIMRQATSMKRGEQLFQAGDVLQASDIGLLAEVGHREITVYRQPRAMVLATGNELMHCNQDPQPGKIRNSNGPMLTAALRGLGCEVTELPIGRDDQAQLRQLIQQGLETDLLVLSGGVSAGDLDLVPATLAECGVKEVFHKVKLKPGKPILFGTYDRSPGKPNATTDSPTCYVFGLPGNPVSSLIGLKLFVERAIQKMTGQNDSGTGTIDARMAVNFSHRGPRPTCWPSNLEFSNGQLLCHPLDWKGSADQRTIASANGLALFAAGDHDYSTGDPIRVIVNRRW